MRFEHASSTAAALRLAAPSFISRATRSRREDGHAQLGFEQAALEVLWPPVLQWFNDFCVALPNVARRAQDCRSAVAKMR
jgi:hypothetical protein